MKYLKILILFFLVVGITAYLKTEITPTTKNLKQIKKEIIPKPTKCLENRLPDKHQIKTAFIEQAPFKDWSQPWQDACEEAALLTVDYYYKNQTPSAEEVKTAILDMIEFENNNQWGKDVNIQQMAQISSQHLGYNTEIIDNPTIDQIKTYISQDIPVVITASGKTLFKENKYFQSGGPEYHSLTILGYDDLKKQFIVHDVGTRHGKNFRYSYDLLMKSIHDLPNNGQKEDILDGEKRVLILLK